MLICLNGKYLCKTSGIFTVPSFRRKFSKIAIIARGIATPVPFIIYRTDNVPDKVEVYDEFSCQAGSYGLLKGSEFIEEVIKLRPTPLKGE